MNIVETARFGTVSLITQGRHRFFTLTMPSEILAKTCVASTREEDPVAGFQRVLSEKRAIEIAAYIDEGLGTIPSSIILSAQEEAQLHYDSRAKSITFIMSPKAFLILDGQHRVFGFAKAKTNLRVPVVIYTNLSKRDESRLFIDINSKQQGVPPELLIDIKKLAEYETSDEERLRVLFDAFRQDNSSVLFGKLSPASKSEGKITRSTFNTAMRPMIKVFGLRDDDELYYILNNYYNAIHDVVFAKNKVAEQFFQPNVFKAVCAFFGSVAKVSKDRFGPTYKYEEFEAVLSVVSENVKVSRIREARSAYKPLIAHLEDNLAIGFTL